ncbi:AraC family transcriptional regulator [Adhaeribacter radiodurans]|uniref:Helix-turn-helix transcriptional regulator n=1 Tax=Adhaeribacter radiodurans TaxID=2745197 RepID=A0A7L7L6X3_9BACT|nr:AraC family transcriptional regulator [Adhaeribacter radiodurans]QMU28592.1 helix-turn-helix transcriptional regulator [Adhaeribacter radiodurans]
MKRYIQYEPFNIYLFTASEWQHPVHKHSYFEIIFIRSGQGKHFINGNTFTYSAGDVFLLGPEDYHYFEIEEKTTFCYLRFTEAFVKDATLPQSTVWMRTIKSLLNAPYQSCGSIVSNAKEKGLLEHLLTVLLHEYEQRTESSYELIMNGIMKAILGILARNVVHEKGVEVKDPKSSQLIEEILSYISQHIQKPEQLRMDQLVEQFNYSPTYLSVFFKRQTGESLQQYILKYKLQMIRNRLQFSDRSIAQITYEYGFTDGSHLNKLFKKYYGLTPGEFRNKLFEKV